MIYFEIPLAGRTISGNPAYPVLKAGLASVGGPFQCDDGTETLKITCSAGEIRDYLVKGHLANVAAAGIALPDARQLDMSSLVEAYGTAAYKQQIERQKVLDEAREEVRGVVSQDAPDVSGIDLNAPPKDVTGEMMKAHKGVCLARSHGQSSSMKVLLDNVQNGKVEMLFLEEFTVDEQDALNDYLDGDDPELPPTLKTKVEILRLQMVDWEPILKAARKKVKIFAIDGGGARDIGDSSGTEAFGEQRDVMMNAVVKRVMDDAIQKNPTLKFMAVVGAAHANTHRGGIPGVSQMYGIPAVQLNDSLGGDIELLKEDKSLRGMPSRDEQIFIDRQILHETKRQKLKGDTQPKVRAAATAQAAALKKAGVLPAFEDQLYLAQYEKKAAKDLAGKNPTPEELRFAAEQNLDAKRKALKVEFDRLNGPLPAKLKSAVEVDPAPPNAEELKALHAAAVLDASKMTLEKLTLAIDKLKCLDKKLNGEAATPATTVSMAGIVDAGNLDAELTESRARVAEFKGLMDIRKEATDLREQINTGREELVKLEALAGQMDITEAAKKKRKAIADLELEFQQKEAAFALKMQTANPAVINVTDEKGRNLLHWAGAMESKDALKAVLDRCPSAKLDLPDAEGNTALHLSIKNRHDMGGTDSNDRQNDAADYLLKKGAGPNVQNNDGSTPAHLVAKTNNTKVLKTLFDGGADLTLKDKRDWSALDTCIAATSVEAEKLFYSEGKAPQLQLGDATAKVTTIDLLCKATLCEDPADKARVRAVYEKMYADPALQPVLNLAALDASEPRDPPKKGGRIVIASGKTVSNLYLQPPGYKAQYPSGAFDEKAGVMMTSNRKGEQVQSEELFAGVIVHEMTHMSANIVNKGKPFPFEDDDDDMKEEYIKAIQEDAKNLHLLTPTSGMDQRALDRLCTRLDEYKARKGDDGLLEECIVSVPQLIAEYGSDAIDKLAPNLSAFYKTKYLPKCKEVADSARFAGARGTLDNAPLVGLKPKPPKPPKFDDEYAKKDNPALTVDDLMKKIETDYTVQYGTKTGEDIAFKTGDFALGEKQKKELKKKLAAVRKGLTAVMTDKLVTMPISNEDIRKLVRSTTDLTHVKKEGDLEKLVAARTNNWLTDAKCNYINAKLGKGETLEDVELAESVAINTEMAAVKGTDFNVNTDKHARMVTELQNGLRNLPPDKKNSKDLQMDLIDRLVKSASGTKDKGVFVKTGKKVIGRRDPKHVSINTKNAKSSWLDELETIKTS